MARGTPGHCEENKTGMRRHVSLGQQINSKEIDIFIPTRYKYWKIL